MIGFKGKHEKRLQVLLLYAIIMFVKLRVISGQSQSACETVSKESGICVPIKTCTVIIHLLTNLGPSPPAPALEYVRKSHCGTFANTPHVCCSARDVSTTATTTTSPSVLDSADESIESWNPIGLGLLNSTRCGQISGDKISNGEVTALSEFPWMVLLEYDTVQDNKFLCGGSLVSNRYVLTAAHCVTGTAHNLIGVRLGEHNITTEIDCEGKGKRRICSPPVQDIKAEKIIAHPEYDKRAVRNDIALIRLDRKVEFASNIKAVCLPITSQQINTDLDRVFVSGWGTTEKGVSSNVLLKAVIPIKDNSVCQNIFRRSINMTSKQLCAGGTNSVDTCRGDSGGPLFFTAPFMHLTRHVQFGVVSAGGVVCGGEHNYPGIYTRVSSYMKWITDNLEP